MDLLGGDEDAELELGGPDAASFGLNKDYAKRFEKRKKVQELSRLRQLHGDEEDSEDAESEDEDAKLLTPALDLEIFKTIDKIRNKKPDVYDSSKVFFEAGEEEDDDDSGGGASSDGDESAKPAAKPTLTLKQQLLEQGAEALVSDDEDEAEANKALAKRRRVKGQLAYDEEQKELREAFVATAGEEGEEGGEAVAEDEEAGLLRKRTPSGAEAEAETADYSSWLKTQLASGSGPIDDNITLHRYMDEKEQLDESEKFLRDYVLNARWKQGSDPDHRDAEGAENGEEEVGDEGDDAFSEREDDFEREYNFRFEEPGADRIQGHARHAEGSIRRQAQLSRQKDNALLKKEKKEELKEKKAAELRRLKNLKKQEVLERLQSIQKVSGSALPVSEVDLSGDFDPEEWDKRMAQMFNDDYYAQEDAEFKEELQDETLGREMRRGRKGKGGKGGSIEALAAELGKDPSMRQTTQEFMDEYYGLDYEDLIAGDLPTRFKYRQVEPTGFGITDEELLGMSEKILNKRVPIRYIKRPYARFNEAKLKSRANRLRYESLAQEREEERKAKLKGGGAKKKAAGRGGLLKKGEKPVTKKGKVAKTEVGGAENKHGGEASVSGKKSKPTTDRRSVYSGLKGVSKRGRRHGK